MARNIFRVVSKTTEYFLREEPEAPKPDAQKCQRILADLRTFLGFHRFTTSNQFVLPVRPDSESAYGCLEADELAQNQAWPLGWNPGRRVKVVVLASTKGVKITCSVNGVTASPVVFKKDVYINTIRFVEGLLGL